MLSLAGRPVLEKDLVVPNFFHLWMIEATVLIGTFGAAVFFIQFPRLRPLYNLVSEVYRQFLGRHGLVGALTYTVNDRTPYRQVCAFTN